jgi:hypothetical protein
MWEAADGKSMGRQQIYDQRLNISTEWFNRENSWSTQVKVSRNDSVSTGLIFYFSLQVSFYGRNKFKSFFRMISIRCSPCLN